METTEFTIGNDEYIIFESYENGICPVAIKTHDLSESFLRGDYLTEEQLADVMIQALNYNKGHLEAYSPMADKAAESYETVISNLEQRLNILGVPMDVV